jgi:hypothetical protein
MTTTLETQADTIVMLSKEIETAETDLQYTAGDHGCLNGWPMVTPTAVVDSAVHQVPETTGQPQGCVEGRVPGSAERVIMREISPDDLYRLSDDAGAVWAALKYEPRKRSFNVAKAALSRLGAVYDWQVRAWRVPLSEDVLEPLAETVSGHRVSHCMLPTTGRT